MSFFLDRFIHKTLRRPYRLHVATNSGNGQPVVFLHGIASNNHTWRHVVPLMPPHLNIITIDLLGFGKSPKPTWNQYSPSDHANAVAKTIKRLGVNQPVIVVGHSMGSLIAVALAKRHPKTVKHLVLCSMPIYINENDDVTAQYSKAERLVNDAYFKAYAAIRQRPDFTLNNAARLKKVVGDSTSFLLTKETWVPFKKSLINTIEKQTTMADIAKIGKPIDIIYGTLDMLIVASPLKAIAAKNNNVSLHRIVAGHDISPKFAKKVAAIIVKA